MHVEVFGRSLQQKCAELEDGLCGWIMMAEPLKDSHAELVPTEWGKHPFHLDCLHSHQIN